MYIAFKWLVGLSLTMWVAMCVMDSCYLRNKEINRTKTAIQAYDEKYQNITARVQIGSEYFTYNFNRNQKKKQKRQLKNFALLHYIMFFAGGISVTMFNKKNEMVFYTKKILSSIEFQALIQKSKITMKKAAYIASVIATNNIKLMKQNIQKVFIYLQSIRCGLKINVIDKHKELNIMLLTKLKEFAKERKKMGQLLVAAVHENKNIRTQFRLETLTKNRLVKYIENANHQIKQNRLQNINFQHLYLVTNQENVLLKARIRKIKQEKENIEKDLMNIISKVYQMKNAELIAYCSQFIVSTKEIFLKSDVAAEVQRFLQTSNHNEAEARETSTPEDLCKNEGNISIQQNATAFSDKSDAPNLIGLPGERIWTVKDRNGLIKKLYEFDSKPDLESGDAIRSIREYSVYFDKDCLLDFSRSRVIVSEIDDINLIPRNTRFLTGSVAFQKFLQNCVVPQSSSKPSLLYI